MKNSVLILLLGLLAIGQTASAQFHVHGVVRDAISNETIPFATVRVGSGGVAANLDGQFEVHLDVGVTAILISSVGYESQTIEITQSYSMDAPIVVALHRDLLNVEEIVVSGHAHQIDDPASSARNANGMEELFDRVPGADLLSRANFAQEPVIRGLSGGQIGLVIDGMPVIGACVDKMDPSTSYVEADNLQRLELSKGGFDLTNSSQIGGTINLVTAKPNFDEPFGLNAAMGYSSAAFGRNGRVAANIAHKGAAVRASYTYRDAGDFLPGNGVRIAESGFRKNNYKLDYAQKLSMAHKLSASMLVDNAWDVGYPVLLMDATLAKARIYSLTHEHHSMHGLLEHWESKIYRTTVNHWMDDFGRDVARRTVMRAMNMPMHGSTETIGGRSMIQLRKSTQKLGITLEAFQTKSFGDMWMFSQFESIADMYLLNLGDVRVRTGAAAIDYSLPLGALWTARVNGRLEISPRTVTNPQAAAVLAGHWGEENIDRRYAQGSASLSLQYVWKRMTRFRVSFAHVSRLPTHIENYGMYVYNYVDGYFYTGNPNLKPERSSQAEIGIEHASKGLILRSSVYANYIDNYIMGRSDASLPSASSTLRFRLYDNARAAVLLGGELSGIAIIGQRFEVAATASYTWGQNLELEEPLYLIPPLTSTVSLRYTRSRSFSEIETRMAMPQNRVARIVAQEDGTDGYLTVNLRNRTTIGYGVSVESALENVFNAYYHEHLSFGNLPSLGRNLRMTMVYQW